MTAVRDMKPSRQRSSAAAWSAVGEQNFTPRLRGRRRAAVLLFSYYLADPRPLRAAEALAGQTMKIEVICLRQTRTEPRRETVAGVPILRLPLKRRRAGALAYVMQYAAFVLAAFLVLSFRPLRSPYALVHVHDMPDVLVMISPAASLNPLCMSVVSRIGPRTGIVRPSVMARNHGR